MLTLALVCGAFVLSSANTELGEEISIPVVEPAPVPRIFPEVNFNCYQTGHSIPHFKSCDGIIDCPMGEDEESCDGRDCSHAGISCTKNGAKFCLTDLSQFCNGEQFCDEGTDEDPRMCNEESFCENYCLSNGVCDAGEFKCKCPTGFSGKRCF